MSATMNTAETSSYAEKLYKSARRYFSKIPDYP